MKCDLCNKPAVVHEVTVKNGVKREIHLCEEHAAESGVAMPGQQPIDQLLTQFTISQGEESEEYEKKSISKVRKRSSRRTCPECGMNFEQFRKSGLLGCPTCYDTFEQQLTPLIERAQNGGGHHAGKAPRRAGTSIDRQRERQRLVKELDEAVNAEQYERAAKIRDTLRSLEHTPDESKSLPSSGESSNN